MSHLRKIILLLALLFPFTAYAGDINLDLIEAAEEGDTVAVKSLLEKGAQVNAKDKDGETALMKAEERGYSDVVKLLKDAGAKE